MLTYEAIIKKLITAEQAWGLFTPRFRKNRRIVFTNGCFDLLHRGHIYYLSRAREMGDILIVGLNSDQSVTRLKGAGRPVNNQVARAEVLGALGMVDYVILFEEDTPAGLIRILKPDILV
jgi:rfaE bifunctional protein nucleotidyltransferase chain/domain